MKNFLFVFLIFYINIGFSQETINIRKTTGATFISDNLKLDSSRTDGVITISREYDIITTCKFNDLYTNWRTSLADSIKILYNNVYIKTVHIHDWAYKPIDLSNPTIVLKRDCICPCDETIIEERICRVCYKQESRIHQIYYTRQESEYDKLIKNKKNSKN